MTPEGRTYPGHHDSHGPCGPGPQGPFGAHPGAWASGRSPFGRGSAQAARAAYEARAAEAARRAEAEAEAEAMAEAVAEQAAREAAERAEAEKAQAAEAAREAEEAAEAAAQAQEAAVEAEEVADAAEGAADEAAAQAQEDAPASADDELARARAEAEAWRDRHLRLQAEWETYRRRMAEQRAEERERATEKLVSGLIPVIDDFDRTLAYATENGGEGLVEGVEAVRTKLLAALEADGVEVIDPKGEPFDALSAQAVATIPDPSLDDETVVEVFQRGYRMGIKVLRPAMVSISVGGPARAKTDGE